VRHGPLLMDAGAVSFLFLREPDPDCLDESETRRLEAFASLSRRAEFVLGRTALRTLAGGILGVSPREVPLRVGPSGAPYLEGCELRISLSHSGGGALAAAAQGPVGCDLEAPSARNRDALLVADRFFSPLERQELRACGEDERHDLFLRMWNRKEAAFKCGVLDWTECMVHAWRDGRNELEGGTMDLSEPKGLPPGWRASLALWRAG
jgi:4'-phosphopantetheinyl transferase EntD